MINKIKLMAFKLSAKILYPDRENRAHALIAEGVEELEIFLISQGVTLESIKAERHESGDGYVLIRETGLDR